MRAGERRTGSTRTAGPLADVPLLRVARRRTQRTLVPALERLRLPAGAAIAEAGRPVHWVAIPLDGRLAAEHRSWSDGRPVHLGEALLHGVAPETVVVAEEAEVVLVPIRALTAAISADAGLGLAVARVLAGEAADREETVATPRSRGFERRRVAPLALGPAA